MKKSTKGALAAGAAAVLLIGGAGTLAYWTDDATLDGGTVDSGELKLSDGTCDTGWEYAAGEAGAGDAVTAFVPGDVITKDCTFDITAVGDNLSATLTTPSTVTFTSPTGTSLTATVGVTYTIAGTAVPATITDANDGDTVTAAINVEFPYGTDETGAINKNDTQDITAELDDIDVTLVQSNPNP